MAVFVRYPRARRRRRCSGGSYDCTHTIEPGTRYVDEVCSPHHDGITGDSWWRFTLCPPCGTHYRHTIPDKPDTSRRVKRADR